MKTSDIIKERVTSKLNTKIALVLKTYVSLVTKKQ